MDSVETQEHSSHNTSKLPKFWDLLTDEDKIGYNNLKAIFDENEILNFSLIIFLFSFEIK